jgi:hypothetical protein
VPASNHAPSTDRLAGQRAHARSRTHVVEHEKGTRSTTPCLPPFKHRQFLPPRHPHRKQRSPPPEAATFPPTQDIGEKCSLRVRSIQWTELFLLLCSEIEYRLQDYSSWFVNLLVPELGLHSTWRKSGSGFCYCFIILVSLPYANIDTLLHENTSKLVDNTVRCCKILKHLIFMWIHMLILIQTKDNNQT